MNSVDLSDISATTLNFPGWTYTRSYFHKTSITTRKNLVHSCSVGSWILIFQLKNAYNVIQYKEMQQMKQSLPLKLSQKNTN